jgi:hypothetical protein
MRRFAFAVAGVLALSPLVGLASVSAPASAAVAHPVAAARAAIPDTSCGWTPDNEFGYLYANGSAAGSQIFVSASDTITNNVWCEDLDGVSAPYELLRLSGTSECAQYEGGSGGGDSTWLELEACDSGKTAQLWFGYYSATTGKWVAYTEYPGLSSSGSLQACLSSDKPPTTDASEKAYMVAVSGGCPGAGGQSWNGFPTG